MDFIFILSLWYYTSMDFSQRALQTNGKLFFKFVVEILAGNWKIFKKKCEAWIFIKVRCVIHQWIWLQIKGNFFFNFAIIFWISYNWEAFVLNSSRYSTIHIYESKKCKQTKIDHFRAVYTFLPEIWIILTWNVIWSQEQSTDSDK